MGGRNSANAARCGPRHGSNETRPDSAVFAAYSAPRPMGPRRRRGYNRAESAKVLFRGTLSVRERDRLGEG